MIGVPPGARVLVRRVGRVVNRSVVQLLHCVWVGHEDLRTFERARLSLRCINCGRQTRGWQVQA